MDAIPKVAPNVLFLGFFFLPAFWLLSHIYTLLISLETNSSGTQQKPFTEFVISF